MTRKGIVLAGGTGSRLSPITQGLSKQLVPVYDKPMVYYPLSVLMLAGIREIAVITRPEDREQFHRFLGDGSQWGVSIAYLVQPRPEGLAQSYLIAEAFLDGAASALVLGDNIFFGHGLTELLHRADARPGGGTIFATRVQDPQRYGVVRMDADGTVLELVEKPQVPPSHYAVTGLYFLDGAAPARARDLTPSARGELEIVSLLDTYRAERSLEVIRMGRGFAWLDTGTHDSLLDAGNFVRTLQSRQGLQCGCLEEIAFDQGWIDREALKAQAARHSATAYGAYLDQLATAPPQR
ncbi:glucose-1-phosphate thymidylyltransferase [Rhodobacteraceae bacterium CCMM004]|nr:glucose-1-phosphate thymidylyltransferase [Rhodobacteraceae bacterium CCMM004]